MKNDRACRNVLGEDAEQNLFSLLSWNRDHQIGFLDFLSNLASEHRALDSYRYFAILFCLEYFYISNDCLCFSRYILIMIVFISILQIAFTIDFDTMRALITTMVRGLLLLFDNKCEGIKA